MSEQQTIRGQTTMTWGDQARCSVRPILRYMMTFTVAMSGVLLFVWMITSSDREWLLLRHEPIRTLALVARDGWPFFAGSFALSLTLLIGAYVWAFYRFPDANRRLSYEANEDGIVTRDAADFALTVPWSSVVRVRNSDYMMRMRLSAGIWRTVFWRAFAPEDREQILRWARQAGQPAAAASAATQTVPES